MVAALAVCPAVALDPPHDATSSIECSSCHTPHSAAGGAITTVAGNANLCLSCHLVGGPATALPFVDTDQALPGPGLPTTTSPTGTSHRWDSGPAGHVERGPGNTSPGGVVSGGEFTGRFAKTYTVSVTAGGDVGTATFSWVATTPGGGSGSGTTGTDVALDEGLTVTFLDGTTTPSFVAGDTWRIYVRTDLRQPVTAAMASRLEDGRLMCSTCHDQHSQEEQPFDPDAPAYGGSGTGAGRHFQRVTNDTNQMCKDCHIARDVAAAAEGSHPIGLGSLTTDCAVCHDVHNPPPNPPRTPMGPDHEIECMTCHQVHYSAASDGELLRSTDLRALCRNCHYRADYATPATHLDLTSVRTLWPGGQYGSSFPAITDFSRRGTCANCHRAHGWPDAADIAQDYPVLQVDFEENLCFTCHDGSPVAGSGDVMSEFGKTSAHPLDLASGAHSSSEPAVVADRHVECVDCHNPHRATARVSLPGPSTTPRPAEGPLAGVRGLDATGADVEPAQYEYEVCFRCHADSPGLPSAPTPRQFPQTNVRLELDGTYPSFHPVVVAGVNPDVPSLSGGWTTGSIMGCTSCHNNNVGPGGGGSGSNGPHGSTNPHLLERRYETADNTPFSLAAYALCFKCHSWNSIGGDDSFGEHNKHINGEDTPCNVCHDPHASSGSSKLVNFDTSVVSPFGGTLEFLSTGQFQGSCTLTCHGEEHDGWDYAP